jgi:hypothetical protein
MGASARSRPAATGTQLVLSPFAPGALVSFLASRGRRVGRFVGIVDRGRRRGLAEVAIGGRLMPEERAWVAPEALRLGAGSDLISRGSPAEAVGPAIDPAEDAAHRWEDEGGAIWPHDPASDRPVEA